jgi:hypothetical protein
METFLRQHPVLPADLDAARALARAHLGRARDDAALTIAAKDPVFLGVGWRRLEAAFDEVIVCEHERQAARAAEGLAIDRWLERAFALPLAGTPPLTLGGTPDRVEVEHRDGVATTLRVLDYKVSRDRAKFGRLLDPEKELGRTGFQIPVYLLGALGAGVAGVGAETELEGGYLVALVADKWVVATMPRALLGVAPAGPGDPEPIVERIRALVAAAQAGRFDVDPRPCDPHCDYRSVCRYQPPPLEDEMRDG